MKPDAFCMQQQTDGHQCVRQCTYCASQDQKFSAKPISEKEERLLKRALLSASVIREHPDMVRLRKIESAAREVVRQANLGGFADCRPLEAALEEVATDVSVGRASR
jgi:hypothetical protein